MSKAASSRQDEAGFYAELQQWIAKVELYFNSNKGRVFYEDENTNI